jgi:hypothetical protein
LGGTQSVLSALGVTTYSGVDENNSQDMIARQNIYGVNRKKDRDPKSIFSMVHILKN